MSQTSRFLLVLGVLVIVVGVISNVINFVHVISLTESYPSNIAHPPLNIPNLASYGIVFLGSLTQGATLIGLGKIIQLLEQKQ